MYLFEQKTAALYYQTSKLVINPQSFYCLYLMEYEGKYLEKYLNTYI